MASNSAGGSTLGNLAARRAQLLKQRERLSLTDSSGVGGARPQGNVQTVQPTPKGPAAPTAATPDQTAPQPQPPAAQPAARGGAKQYDPQMLQQATDFLNQVKSSGGPPAAETPDLEMAPPTVSPSLTDQIQAVGADNLSPVAQFMRVAGRPPTGREMVIFSATKALEDQLGRPPTRNELLMHVTSQAANPNNTGPEPVAF